MAPLTLTQARKVLAGTKGWADVDGFMRVYESMLRTHAWVDQPVRSAEVERVRLNFVETPLAPRLQVLSALGRSGDRGFTAAEIVEQCRPVAEAQVAAALDALTREGSIEAVGPGRRWRKTGTAPPAATMEALAPPLLTTAQHVWHAWGVSDVETVISYCRDDVVLRAAPPLATFVGHDGLRKFRAELAEHGVTWKTTVQLWTQQGEDVVIRALFRVRTSTDAYDRDAICLYRFRGNEIALIQLM